MNNRTSKVLATSITGAILTSIPVYADLYNGNGADNKWENPDNWALGAVPLNNGSGNTFINAHDVVFDNDTWIALDAANNLQSATQYRVVRFLLNESTSGPIGTGSMTFDFDSGGVGRNILQTNSNSSIWGSRTGSTTANFISGTVNTSSGTTLGARDGEGIFNITGGNVIIGRSSLTLGNANGTGTGTINISSGSLTTRAGITVGGTSTFHVEGTAATVGIGSEGSLDGFWDQAAGGILRTGINASGITSILIDDSGDDGAGAQGNVSFAAGSILDPYDAGSAAVNTWQTVMEWEGALTDNGLALSTDAINAGWEKQVVGSELQVRIVPEPSTALLSAMGLLGLGFRRRS